MVTLAGPTQGRLPFALQAGEHVLRLCRRHWLYMYPKLAWQLVVAVAVPAVLLVAVNEIDGLGGPGGRVALALSAAWFLYWLVRCYFTWFRYQNDLWVITNQRIVDSIRRHWFHHRMASADLVDVEDMAVVREGVLHTLFNYGDVRCQTAGQVANFILAGIPSPSDVLGIVDAARDSARRELAHAAET